MAKMGDYSDRDKKKFARNLKKVATDEAGGGGKRQKIV